MKRSIILTAIVLLAFLNAAHAQTANKILVVVNGTPITSYDLEQQLDTMAFSAAVSQRIEPTPEVLLQLKQQLRDDVLNEMVEDVLLHEEIERLKLEVGDDQVDAYVDKIIQGEGLENEEQLGERLAEMNQTLESFRAKIKKDMQKQRLVQGMVGSKLVITDAQIEEEFASNPEYVGGTNYHLRVIMTGSRETMDEAVEKIDDGEMTFAEAAQQYSTGPVPEEGGDMGFIPKSGMNEQWRAAIEGLDVGSRSEVFEAQGTFVVLFVEGTSSMSVDDVPGMREKIFQQLREEKMTVLFDEYMARLKDIAVIEWK